MNMFIHFSQADILLVDYVAKEDGKCEFVES